MDTKDKPKLRFYSNGLPVNQHIKEDVMLDCDELLSLIPKEMRQASMESVVFGTQFIYNTDGTVTPIGLGDVILYKESNIE